MHAILKEITRRMVLAAVFFLPQERRIAIERWLRGREELRKLRHADAVVVSYGKSGRTWLRAMISRFYQVKHRLSERHPMDFDNLHRKDRGIPKLFFTHDNYIKDYTNNGDSKADFYDKKVVLLVRDPRDVAVSRFFQWKYRMRPSEKLLNGYPVHGEEASLYDFVMDPGAGLPGIIDYMNLWRQEAPRVEELLVVHYEDMHANPRRVLRRVLDFIGTPGSDDEIKAAVEFASYDNMKKLEQNKVFWLGGGRVLPGDRNNPDAYKVRRGKVGGYRDYFDDDQIAAIDHLLDSGLHASYGYGRVVELRKAVNA